MTRMVSIRLEDEIDQRLEFLASETGRTKTFYVREAVLEHLEALEDAFLADKVLSKVRNGEEKTLSLKEAMSSLGL
jgi:RHH-type rel operon transcriptional repressor/antitoxin RelB